MKKTGDHKKYRLVFWFNYQVVLEPALYILRGRDYTSKSKVEKVYL